jgi:RNA polymerase sigma-70 factor, ECF subfamily
MCRDEKILILDIKNSNNSSFEKIFHKYQPVLFKYILYKTNNYNLSQDIVQETFFKVWMNRSSLKPNLSFFSYLSKISNNLLKDHYKHLQVRDKYKDSIPQVHFSFGEEPEKALELKQFREQIHKAANKYLSETCRTIFFLSRVEGKSNSEIATTMNIPNKKVENQLFYALKILRKKIDIR